MTLSRRIVAEGLGTGWLLAAVVGSGVMGQELAGGNIALALLANTLATSTMLATLIFAFGPISGAHFNPAVTLADAPQGGLSWGEVPAYIVAQVVGALIGVGTAHLMFGQALLQVSRHARAGGGQLLSEFIAIFGLLSVIWGSSPALSPRRHFFAGWCPRCLPKRARWCFPILMPAVKTGD